MLRAFCKMRSARGFSRGRYTCTTSNLVVNIPSKWSAVTMKPRAIRSLHGGCFDLCFCYRFLSTRSTPSATEDLQTALARTETVREVLDVWQAHKNSVYSHNVVRSSLYYALKAAQAEGFTSSELFAVARFEQFWSHLTKEVPSMSANSAIKCLYNCAQYDFKNEELSDSLVDVCTRKCQMIPTVSIGILLWSLKHLDLVASSSVQPLLTHTIELFHTRLKSGERFKAQSFTNVLWVLATTGNLSKELSETVITCLPQYVKEFDFHSLSLVLWSLTGGGGVVLPQPLLDSAGRAAAKFVNNRERSAPNLVHTCLAFATAEYYHQPFCEALSQLIIREPKNSPLLTPRLLSCVAWMCAKVSYFNTSLLDSIASRALASLSHFNSQDLGNLIYSYAQLNYPHRELVRQVTRRFLTEKRLWDDEEACVSIAWANLAIEEYPVQLLEHLVEPSRVARLIKAGDKSSLNLLLRLEALLKSDLRHLRLSLPHRSAILAQTLTQFKWSVPQSRLQNRIVNVLSEITGRNEDNTPLFTLEALTTTLYCIDIEIMLDYRGKPIPIPHHWTSWEDLKSLMNSHFLGQHSPKLQELLQKFYKESNDSSSLNLASDWADLVGGPEMGVAKRVAIEADGPWHYAANCPHTLGKTLLKRRVLRAQGWTVVSIPYYEWQRLKNKQAKVNFLKTKIFTTEN